MLETAPTKKTIPATRCNSAGIKSSNPSKETNMTMLSESPARHIESIDKEIVRLSEQKRDAIQQMLRDCEWMEIPLVQLDELHLDHRSDRTSDQIHLLDTIWFNTDTIRPSDLRAHSADRCPRDGYWCRKVGDTRRPVGRSSIGFKYLGTFDVVARQDSIMYLVESTRVIGVSA